MDPDLLEQWRSDPPKIFIFLFSLSLFVGSLYMVDRVFEYIGTIAVRIVISSVTYTRDTFVYIHKEMFDMRVRRARVMVSASADGISSDDGAASMLKILGTQDAIDLSELQGDTAEASRVIGCIMHPSICLKELVVPLDKLDDDGARELMDGLSISTTLLKLTIRGGNIREVDIVTTCLARGISQNSSLVELCLLGIRYTGDVADTLADAIERNSSMTSLVIERDLGDNTWGSFLRCLADNTNIKTLHLSNAWMCGQSEADMSYMLSRNSVLLNLTAETHAYGEMAGLGRDHIARVAYRDHIDRVARAVEKSTSIESLTLGGYGIEEDMYALTSMLKGVHSMQKLDIKNTSSIFCENEDLIRALMASMSLTHVSLGRDLYMTGELRDHLAHNMDRQMTRRVKPVRPA